MAELEKTHPRVFNTSTWPSSQSSLERAAEAGSGGAPPASPRPLSCPHPLTPLLASHSSHIKLQRSHINKSLLVSQMRAENRQRHHPVANWMIQVLSSHPQMPHPTPVPQFPLSQAEIAAVLEQWEAQKAPSRSSSTPGSIGKKKKKNFSASPKPLTGPGYE